MPYSRLGGGCCRCHHACDNHAGSQSCGYSAGRGVLQASRSLGGVRLGGQVRFLHTP